MPHRQSGPYESWKACGRAFARALALGAAAACAAALFGAACGAALCIAEGTQWACALWWAGRAALAGFAAGAVIGCVSGVYHVEERRPDPGGAPPSGAPAAARRPAPTIPAAWHFRGRVRPRT